MSDVTSYLPLRVPPHFPYVCTSLCQTFPCSSFSISNSHCLILCVNLIIVFFPLFTFPDLYCSVFPPLLFFLLLPLPSLSHLSLLHSFSSFCFTISAPVSLSFFTCYSNLFLYYYWPCVFISFTLTLPSSFPGPSTLSKFNPTSTPS